MTISKGQIKELRMAALLRGDVTQAAICERALDFSTIGVQGVSVEDQRRVMAMTVDQARAECARVASAQGA